MSSVSRIQDYFKKLNPATYRSLTKEEIGILIQNQNHASNWEDVKVADPFTPSLIRQSEFLGAVFLEALEPAVLESEGISFSAGIYQSTLMNCHIGKRVCIRNVHLLSGYRIEDDALLFNIDELSASEQATFGQGFVRNPEDERNWIELVNENGGRQIAPFAGMLPSDAYLWTKYRADSALQKAFLTWTDRLAAGEQFRIATIGAHTSIRNCRTLRDVWTGSHANIESASRLVNITIQSTQEEPTSIGSGADLRDGVVGPANAIYSNVIAENFCTGRNVHLKYGVRFINNYLGANSTISCCEVLSNLLFPFHEQHHNNSFLIATFVMGQDNIAAGATIGSNHNSRSPDGEIFAKRGFWPGLSTSFKHNSYFASFALIAKGTYYAEMNIHLPFSLVSPGPDLSSIFIMPGYWFKYNMYALARNSWKFARRDKRKVKEQHIETDYLAPDTVEELLHGIRFLQQEINKALGKEWSVAQIMADNQIDKKIKLELDGFLSKGRAIFIKPAQGLKLFHMIAAFYGVNQLLQGLAAATENGASAREALQSIKENYNEPDHHWENFGGQIVPQSAVRQLIAEINQGTIRTWAEVHQRYNQWWQEYPQQKRNHGIYTLLALYNKTIDQLNAAFLKEVLPYASNTAIQLKNWAWESREKDYTNPYRLMTFHSKEELIAVTGKIEENSFLIDYKNEMESFAENIDRVLKQLD